MRQSVSLIREEVMVHLKLVLVFALLYSFVVVANGRSILDPIGSGATVKTSAVSGDKGLGVDPNG
jgi:hypothetical protein